MAYNGFHRSVKAGVALAGAGAVAFSTVQAVPAAEEVVAATPRVVTADVQPVVFPNYLGIIGNGVVGTVEETVNAVTQDVPAIFQQVAAQWADINLTPWNHGLIGAALVAPVAPLFVGPLTDAVAESLAQTFPQYGHEIRTAVTETSDYAFARLVGPILSAIGATGAAHQKIYFAGMAGDFDLQRQEIARIPLHIIDGFLWGGYGDLSPLLTGEVGGERIAAPGLLTPWGQWPLDRNVHVPEEGEPAVAQLASQTAEPTDTESSTPAEDTEPETAEDARAVKVAAAGEAAGEAAAQSDAVETSEEAAVKTAVLEETTGEEPEESSDSAATVTDADGNDTTETSDDSEKSTETEKSGKDAESEKDDDTSKKSESSEKSDKKADKSHDSE